MTGLLISDCVVPGLGPASVYCEGGVVARVAAGGDPDTPPGTTVIRANGGTLLPGLADTHCHPFSYGALRRSVDLRGTSNMTGVRLRLQARVRGAGEGEWIVGRGWDQESFPDGRMPARGDIDGVTPSNPALLSRVCGHVALLNTRAIDALGISDMRGPEYERDARGALTGIIKEGALTRAYSAARTAGSSAADLQAAEAEASRLGLTSLSCILSPEGYREELDALLSLGERGALSLRYRVYVPFDALAHLEERGVGREPRAGRVRVCGVKLFADGSLGARTAALREPYADDPGNTGILTMTASELEDQVGVADSKGYQAIVHAIGDRAVEQAVDVLSKFTGGGNPNRHRIEHASLLPRDLRQKMAKHGIRAAIQPLFVTSDAWATARLGDERARDLYPFRSMLADGVVASGSSDSPVENQSPVLGVWASMTRGGSVPEEALSEEEALRLYTANAASNSFDVAGLAEGGPANLTLLDSDIEGMHPALLRKVGVLATVVEGTPVHSYAFS